jgi:hypothetical protein
MQDRGVHLDVEIGDPVAVNIGFKHVVIEAQFAGGVGKGTGADVGEGLILGQIGIGVDGRQVDVIVLGRREVEDGVRSRGLAGLGIVIHKAEHEIVGACATTERVRSRSGDQLIIAGAALNVIFRSMSRSSPVD